MRYILPKSSILRGYQSFSRIISNGVSLQERLLNGYVAIHREVAAGASIGFTVSKKKAPLAVQRNRIKRLLKEAVRKHFYKLRQAAIEKKIRIEIVISYRGNRDTNINRLSLHDIEPEWVSFQRRILEML